MLEKVIKNSVELHEIRSKQHTPVPDTNTHFTVFTLWGLSYQGQRASFPQGKRQEADCSLTSPCNLNDARALLQSSLLFSITHQPHCIKKEGKGLKKTLVPLLHIASKGKTQIHTFYMPLSHDPAILFTYWNESAWNACLNATFSTFVRALLVSDVGQPCQRERATIFQAYCFIPQ